MYRNNRNYRIIITVGLLSLGTIVGGIAYKLHLDRKEFKRKIDAVNSYIVKNGEIEFDCEGIDVKVFSCEGLGFEYNKRISLKSAAYELLVQGTSRLAKDVVKNSLGIRREGEKFDMGDRVLPQISDSVIDIDLDGIDRYDRFIEWGYEPTLKSDTDTKSSYAEKVKDIAKVTKNLIDATAGREVKEIGDEITIERKLNKDLKVGQLSARRQNSVNVEYKRLVDEAYEKISPEK